MGAALVFSVGLLTVPAPWTDLVDMEETTVHVLAKPSSSLTLGDYTLIMEKCPDRSSHSKWAGHSRQQGGHKRVGCCTHVGFRVGGNWIERNSSVQKTIHSGRLLLQVQQKLWGRFQFWPWWRNYRFAVTGIRWWMLWSATEGLCLQPGRGKGQLVCLYGTDFLAHQTLGRIMLWWTLVHSAT